LRQCILNGENDLDKKQAAQCVICMKLIQPNGAIMHSFAVGDRPPRPLSCSGGVGVGGHHTPMAKLKSRLYDEPCG